MFVRTSTYGQNQTQLKQLMAQQSKLLELQAQADSKKKVNTLSDNPGEIGTIMNLNYQLSQIDSYYNNINTASNQLSMIDDTFKHAIDKLQRFKDLGLAAMNGTDSTESVKATKDEIDQLLQSIVDTANTEYNNQYVFAGAKVTTQPYTIERDADGNITGIAYNGSQKDAEGALRKLTISDGVQIAVNGIGEDIFGSYQADGSGSGILQAMGDFSSILATYPPDQNALEEAMSRVESGIDKVNLTRSEFGTKAARVTLTKNSLQDLEMQTTSHKSSLVDLDMAEALSNLIQQNYAYQSSMSIYSMLQQNSLLNYI